MWVYIYQSWTEKELKNAYIGEYRVPGENTILYIPLKSDIKWYTGASMAEVQITTDTLSWYRTFSNGVCRFNYNQSTHNGAKTIYNIAPTWLTSWTMSIRFNLDQYRWNSHFITTNLWGLALIASDQNLRLELYWSSTRSIRTGTVSLNTWYNLVWVRDWSNYYLYLNWVLANSGSWISGSGSWKSTVIPWRDDNSVDWSPRWYMSEVIYEDKARTVQEVANYYNNTKNLYWIS